MLDGAGALDVLIANAGVHDGGAGLALSGEELAAVTRRVLEVDVLGYVLALQAAGSSLVEHLWSFTGGRQLVNRFGSLGEIPAIPVVQNVLLQSCYPAKAELTGLLRCNDETRSVQLHAG